MKKNIVIIVSVILITATLLFIYIPKKIIKTEAKADVGKALIVGTNSEFPPFEYLENGELVGFEIDVVRHIAQSLGKTVIFRDLPFDALIPEVQTGEIHMIAAGMTPTSEREKRVYFTTPILDKNPLVVVSLASKQPITSLDQLKGKTVAVNEGYFADKYISSLSNVTVLRIASASIGEAFVGLQSGRADALVASQASLTPFLDKQKDGVQIYPIQATDEICALVVARQYPELLDSVNAVIETMKKDGTLQTLQKKWLTSV